MCGAVGGASAAACGPGAAAFYLKPNESFRKWGDPEIEA